MGLRREACIRRAELRRPAGWVVSLRPGRSEERKDRSHPGEREASRTQMATRPHGANTLTALPGHPLQAPFAARRREGLLRCPAVTAPAPHAPAMVPNRGS